MGKKVIVLFIAVTVVFLLGMIASEAVLAGGGPPEIPPGLDPGREVPGNPGFPFPRGTLPIGDLVPPPFRSEPPENGNGEVPDFPGCGAYIFQYGSENTGEIWQSGCHFGLIYQEGEDNYGSIDQRGNNHLSLIYQYGDDNYGTTDQRGNGHIGIIGQIGFGNTAVIDQRGSNHSGLVYQYGNSNYGSIDQRGSNHLGMICQSGDDNFAEIDQRGSGKNEIIQNGSGNTASIQSTGRSGSQSIDQLGDNLTTRLMMFDGF